MPTCTYIWWCRPLQAVCIPTCAACRPGAWVCVPTPCCPICSLHGPALPPPPPPPLPPLPPNRSAASCLPWRCRPAGARRSRGAASWPAPSPLWWCARRSTCAAATATATPSSGAPSSGSRCARAARGRRCAGCAHVCLGAGVWLAGVLHAPIQSRSSRPPVAATHLFDTQHACRHRLVPCGPGTAHVPAASHSAHGLPGKDKRGPCLGTASRGACCPPPTAPHTDQVPDSVRPVVGDRAAGGGGRLPGLPVHLLQHVGVRRAQEVDQVHVGAHRRGARVYECAMGLWAHTHTHSSSSSSSSRQQGRGA